MLDRDLKRLHRVSGEAVSPVTADEPWEAIDGGTLEALARQSIGTLAAWMGGGGELGCERACSRRGCGENVTGAENRRAHQRRTSKKKMTRS